VVVVVFMVVVLAEDTSVEEASMALGTSVVEQDSLLVDQDSVVVRSMEEWVISPNVTLQIGTATGTGGVATSSAIGSLFLTTVSGSDWMTGFILTAITMRTTTRITTGTMRPSIHIRCRRSVPSNRTWPSEVTIAV
jgi:hypothetical protein